MLHVESYGIDGRLKGIPGHKNFYDGELEKAQHGLPEVPSWPPTRGFVLGTTTPPPRRWRSTSVRPAA